MVDLHTSNGPLENPGIRHEPSDASFRWILAIGIGSLVIALILHAAILWFMFDYRNYLSAIRSTSFPLAAEERQQLPPGPGNHPLNGGARAGQHDPLPPEPRLDPLNIWENLPEASPAEFYARDEAILHSEGPATEKGFFHIPIEHAMALVEGKLPVQPEPADERKRDRGLLDWGEPNSGRLLRGAQR